MWVVFGMAFFGLGYAIFASVRRNDPAASHRICPRVSRSRSGEEVSAHPGQKDLKTISSVSATELREILRTSFNLLLLEVCETSDSARASAVIPGALCVSLDRLDKLLTWVPPDERIVLYAIGANNDRLIRMLESFPHPVKVSVLQGGSDAWESGTHANVQAA
ncbi:MAG TPA: hypothetical protein VK638_24920 [Edaphobacter sp.]|nr:hypothetical protein [Edaphobacter sp.]